MLDVGGTLSFSAKLYDSDPAVNPDAELVNPLTAALTISLDGTVIATPVITTPPTVDGTFAFNYPTTAPGRYVGRWLFTFVGGETAAHVETFNVQPSDPGYLISLYMAKKHLNISGADDDDEIRDWLAGITRVVEYYVGACVPRTVVEYARPGSVIRLDQRPVLSVTSITPYLYSGPSYGPSQIRVTEEGTIRLRSGLPLSGWGDMEITYVVGRRPTPPNIIQAVKIILGHLWETQKGPAGSPVSGGDDTQFVPGFGYAVPNRALEMLKPDDEGPAIG
jgi:hypothetical protein